MPHNVLHKAMFCSGNQNKSFEENKGIIKLNIIFFSTLLGQNNVTISAQKKESRRQREI